MFVYVFILKIPGLIVFMNQPEGNSQPKGVIERFSYGSRLPERWVRNVYFELMEVLAATITKLKT